VKANQATFPARVMCRLLHVSVSGFYAWCDRPMSARRRADIALLARIHAIHRKSKGCYGARPIHEELSSKCDSVRSTESNREQRVSKCARESAATLSKCAYHPGE
jgi:hypothetical protein